MLLCISALDIENLFSLILLVCTCSFFINSHPKIYNFSETVLSEIHSFRAVSYALHMWVSSTGWLATHRNDCNASCHILVVLLKESPAALLLTLCFAIIPIWIGSINSSSAKRCWSSCNYLHRIFNNEQGKNQAAKKPLSSSSEFPIMFSLTFCFLCSLLTILEGDATLLSSPHRPRCAQSHMHTCTGPKYVQS